MKLHPLSDPAPEHNRDKGMTHYERGIVHRTIGAPCDIEYLDDTEAVEYLRGYREGGDA